MAELYSSLQLVSDGTLQSVTLTFPYTSREEIHVFLDGQEVAEGWDWSGPTGETIEFDAPLPSGIKVLVRRITKIDEVPYIFGPAAGSRGYAEFSAYTVDFNFDFMKRANQDALDSFTLSGTTAEAAEAWARRAESAAVTSESSASTAQASVTAAAVQAALAQQHGDYAYSMSEVAEAWAENPIDVPVEPGKYSAKHWASKAADGSALALRGDLKSTSGGTHIGFQYPLPGSSVVTYQDRAMIEVSIRDFGATPDSTDSTEAFIKAAEATRGQGIAVRVPVGTYILTGRIAIDHCIFKFDPGVVLDCRGVQLSSVFTVTGTTGAELNTAARVTRGESYITTEQAHGLQVADWILLMSQRSCSHTDAGEGWRLGTLTDGASPVYFAEPLQVKTTSATAVTTSTDVIFPEYRIDRDQETLPGGRARSTVRKINFSTTQFLGSPTILTPEVYSQVFNVQWAMAPVIQADFVFGYNSGGGIYSHYVYAGEYLSEARRPINWTLNGEDHSRYNTFRDVSSWYCNWDCTEWYGSQCWDQTYSNICSIYPRLKMRSYSPMEQGATTHGNTYGVLMDVEVVNHTRTGVSNRARFAEINARTEGVRSSTASNGVTLHEWGQQNAKVKVYSLNNQYAVSFQKSSLSQTDSPENITASITGTAINPVLGVVKFGNRSGQPLTPGSIRLHDWVVYKAPRFLYALEDQYWNGIEVDGVVGTGDGEYRGGAYFQFVDNSAYHTVRNVHLRHVGTESLIRAPRMPDTELNNASGRQSITVEWGSVSAEGFLGNWVDGFLGVPAVHKMQDIVSRGRFNSIVVCNANNAVANRELVLEGGTSHAIPIGGWVEFIANGTGVPYVTAGAGVTLTGSSDGMGIGRTMRVTRVSTNVYNILVL